MRYSIGPNLESGGSGASGRRISDRATGKQDATKQAGKRREVCELRVALPNRRKPARIRRR